MYLFMFRTEHVVKYCVIFTLNCVIMKFLFPVLFILKSFFILPVPVLIQNSTPPRTRMSFYDVFWTLQVLQTPSFFDVFDRSIIFHILCNTCKGHFLSYFGLTF
jgi:hypothetical protein